MKMKQVEKLFIGKLSMQTSENRRHKQYTLISQNGSQVPLLSTVCVSRGSKELSRNNLSGLSEVLGMNLREFESASKCNIGPSSCILGMVVGVLSKARREIENDPITNNWDSTLLLYVPTLLEEVSIRECKSTRSENGAFLEKLKEKVDALAIDSQGRYKKLLEECLFILERLA